jgi:hypothetical protein
LRECHALALPAAQVARKAIPEPGKIEPRQPSFGLGTRGPAVDTIQNKPKRDIVARRLPRQQRIVLKQDADLRTRQAGLDRARKRPLQPDRGAQQTRFARTGRPDQTDEPAILDGEACSFKDRLPAVRDRQIANAQRQPPAIEVS